MNTVVLPTVFVFLGSIIMAINVIGYFKLKKTMNHIYVNLSPKTTIILTIYICLLIFFLFGYIFVGILFSLPHGNISNLFISLIFLFGSLFVLLGIIFQLALCKSVQKSNIEITQALINSIEARDANLNGHSIHVANLSLLIYKNMPEKYQNKITASDLEYAALLHDIGKLGISENILNKEGSLSQQEWLEIKKHPIIGYTILHQLNHFQNIAVWILYHHERPDGEGYLKLRGEEIPLASRIIAVADTYSAITMTRSYRCSRSHKQAVEILKNCRSTQLDKELVDIFLDIKEDDINHCKPKLDTTTINVVLSQIKTMLNSTAAK